nr:hypothetical protein [Tissierella sp.]
MKIKIKLKTLILITILTLTFILFMVPVLNIEIGNLLKEKSSDKAEIFYRSYMKSPLKINHDKGLYSYGDYLTKAMNKYQISSSGWGGAERTSPENMKKAMELYEDILANNKDNGYKGKYANMAYTKLLDTSISTLDTDKLEYWIKWGMETENEEISYISKLYRAYYKFTEKAYKEAEEMLKGLDKDFLDEKYYQLLAEVNLHLDKTDKAREAYKKLEEMGSGGMIDRDKKYFGGSYLLLDQYAIEEKLEKLDGEYKVKGKITNDGKGMPFIEVYLSKDIGVFSTLGRVADAVTDKNGEFETLPLKQGVYDIGIMINPSQLYGKVSLNENRNSLQVKGDQRADFKFASPMSINSPKENVVVKDGEKISLAWDEVDGAEYYMVKTIAFDKKENAGAVYHIQIKDKDGFEKIKDNTIEFGIDNIDKHPKIYSYDDSGEEIINPRTILASFIPNIENPLIVEAYDKSDKIINSSISLIDDYDNIVSVTFDTELTKGEKLILDKKYEQAKDHYENTLKKDPKDKEALLYLARMYSIGWQKGKKDLPKALEYAQNYNDTYDDYNLSLEVIGEMNREQKKANRDYIKTVLDTTDAKDKNYNFYRIQASYFLAEENLLAARDSYEKIEEHQDIEILYIDMYLGNYDRVLKKINEEEISVLKMNLLKLGEVLKKIETIPEKELETFRGFLKTLIEREVSMSEQRQIYKNTLKIVKNQDLKDLVEEIAKEEYLEDEYIIEE